MKENLEFLASWTTIVLFAVIGFRRRRGVWTSGSWRRFIALVVVLALLIAVAMLMATAVDSGFKATLPEWTWAAYTWTIVILAVCCPMALVGLLGWFALGAPEQQLQLKRPFRS